MVIPAFFLNTGKYVVSVDLDVPLTASLLQENRVAFMVEELAENYLGLTRSPRPAGAIHPRLAWSIEQIASPDRCVEVRV